MGAAEIEALIARISAAADPLGELIRLLREQATLNSGRGGDSLTFAYVIAMQVMLVKLPVIAGGQK